MANRGESGTDQKRHWEKTYSDNTSFFGEGPSAFSKAALDLFRNEGVRTVLELGCGQGRDTFLFALEEFEVTALDYSEEGLKGLDARTRWEYLDVIAFVFPFAWTIGRLACTVAHDHPGTLTTFPLAVSLKTPEARAYITAAYRDAGRLVELPGPSELARMAFHDLGWYEFLYTLLVIVPVFLLFDRRPRPPGFYVIVFLLLYVPARFGLDLLRLSDTRYFGLTPGQYAGLAVFVAALYALRRNAAAPRPRSG